MHHKYHVINHTVKSSISEYGTGICRLIYIAITNLSLVAFAVHAVVRAQLKYSGYDTEHYLRKN